MENFDNIPRIESVEDMMKMAIEEMGNAMKEMGKANILIAGRTGVGKSTLVNSVFKENLAETGQGKPVTQTTREISKPGFPLTVFDTRGLEMAALGDTLDELESLLVSRSKETDVSRHIHVAWICIHEDGRRVEEAEIKLHEMLARHVPVIGVITKARSDQGFKAEVQRLLPEAVNVVRVRALPEELDEGVSLEPMGLEELVDVTVQVIPEGIRRAFVAAQKASREQRKREADSIVAWAVAQAALIGVTPIPFSDAALLIPLQIRMIARISALYGISDSDIGSHIMALMAPFGASFVGKTIVSGLLKLVPGVGTMAGGAIAGSTAAAITRAMGNLYVRSLEKACADLPLDEPPSEKVVEVEFRRSLREFGFKK